MARTVLKNKNILVLGVDCAPGRGAALQLSREGAKVSLCSQNEERTDQIAQTLKAKKIETVQVHLPEDKADWEKLLLKARDFIGHYHAVVNAYALTYLNEDHKKERCAEAVELNSILAKLLYSKGPLKILTLWEIDQDLPPDPIDGVWHSILALKSYQRLDNQQVDQLDASGTPHLRAGAISDSVVQVLEFPPSACPKMIELEYVTSSEKDKKS